MQVTKYEDLSGGHGRSVFYRADRFEPSTFFGDQGPETFVNDRPQKLLNLSMSGIATFDPSGRHTEQSVGQIVPIQLRVDNTPLHEGFGKVVRVEPLPSGSKIALKLTDKFIDLPKLKTQYTQYNLRSALAHLRGEQLGGAPEAFRLLCSDILHFLRKYRQICMTLEASDPLRKGDGGDALEILDLAFEQLWSDWIRLDAKAQSIIETFADNAAIVQAAKQYTEMVLTPELMAGSIWKQTYQKPLGYPGDYHVMDYVYSGEEVGDSLYAKLIHRLGVRALECIATRKSMVQQIITREAENWAGAGPFNVSSLACGSAQEIFDYLKQDRLHRPHNLTLIDQDKDALGYAYERAFQMSMELGGMAKIQCLHASFIELMSGGKLFKSLPQQHLLYSMGLLDYLKQPRARRLVESLYEYVAPGGLLLIGNLKTGSNSSLISAEYICDWTMIRRSEEEMYDLVSNLKTDSIELLTDRTDKVYIICVRKPL